MSARPLTVYPELRVLVQANGGKPNKRPDKGFSALAGGEVLFDVSAGFWPAARAMLGALTWFSKIHTIVISHDHWGHKGGLMPILACARKVDLYLPFEIDPYDREIYEQHGARVRPMGFGAIGQGLWLLDPFPVKNGKRTFFEQALAMRCCDGVTLVAAGGHAGLVPMVLAAKERLGKPVLSVIGNFSFRQESEESLIETGLQLRELGVRHFKACHNTPPHAKTILEGLMPYSISLSR